VKKILTGKFKKAFLISLSVLAASVVCWLAFLWLRLDSYEKSMPDNAASRVFNQYFNELAFGKLFALEKPNLSSLETLENYTAYLNDRAGGQRNFVNIPYDAQDTRKYVVFAGGAGFAEFELVKRAGFFNDIWEFSKVATIFDIIEEFKITAPAGSSVYVNSKLVGENYKTGSGLSCPMAGNYDVYTISGLIAKPVVEAQYGGRVNTLAYDSELNEYSAIPVLTIDIIDSFTLAINGIQIDDSFLLKDGIKTAETDRLKLHRKIYRILYGFDDPPEVSIVSAAGKEGVIRNTGDLHFIQEFISDGALEAQYKDRAIATAKTYAEFMTFDTTLRELQRYFETGTEIYNNIRTSEVYFYTPHINYWFENVTASEFFARENDTFSCRVTFDHYVRRNAELLFHFPLDITLFYRRAGGQFMVYDMISNS